MEGIAMNIAAFVCGAALIYVVVNRTMKKREEEASEAGDSVQLDDAA